MLGRGVYKESAEVARGIQLGIEDKVGVFRRYNSLSCNLVFWSVNKRCKLKNILSSD